MRWRHCMALREEQKRAETRPAVPRVPAATRPWHSPSPAGGAGRPHRQPHCTHLKPAQPCYPAHHCQLFSHCPKMPPVPFLPTSIPSSSSSGPTSASTFPLSCPFRTPVLTTRPASHRSLLPSLSRCPLLSPQNVPTYEQVKKITWRCL